MWRGRISLRKLWVRVTNMPRDSAFVQAVDPGAEWGPTDHLIANLIDVTFAAHGSNQRFPRPGEKQAEIARAIARGKRWEQRVAQRANHRGEGKRV